MLRLTRIEEGACYVTETTNFYVAWSMLCSSSRLFWGCGMLQDLDRAKSLADDVFSRNFDKLNAFSELMELFQKIESPVLDAVRTAICFENYFKAKLLLKGYVIHQMDLNICKQHYPQFVTPKGLLQKTTPILMDEIRKAENKGDDSVEPLQTLTKQTIGMKILLNQPEYRAIYSRDQAPYDREPFDVLEELNNTRNTLHFLNIEYIAGNRGTGINDFLFLREYVSSHIDALANKMVDEDKWKLENGKSEIDHLQDIEFD